MAAIRVAAVQLQAGQDIAANLAACLRLIDAAAAQGAQLVVLPEFCNHLSWYASREQAHELATRDGDDFLSAVAERAARHRLHVKINVTHAYADGRTGGTNFLFGPDGTVLGRCDKQTLMGAENDHLDPAVETGPVIDTPLGRIGMYACMEGVISEVTRGLALRGAQLLLNSLNSFATDEASLHVPVRAAENKVWVVAANKVGPLLPEEHLPRISAALGVPPEWLHGAGESQIVAPDGTVVARGPRTGEAVVIADIDPALADAKQRPDGTHVYASRRPDLYGPLAEQPTGRLRPAGVERLRVALVRGPAAAAEARSAALDGVELVVADGLAPVDLVAALAGSAAHGVATGGAHTVLVDATGVLGAQAPLHRRADERAGAPDWTDSQLSTFDLPWGRLILLAGDDTIYPETFRLAAIADADVVVAAVDPQEDWELAYGLPERAAENRLNVIAAAPAGKPGAIYALSPDFTLWTAWANPFTGRISHPLVTPVPPDASAVRATVAPAQAANRNVSRQTNLVDGRPWRLVGALLER
ncbi:carbon-nitrogen hydrolase family protein [Hamadaea tsunoensis]|uniref:carbon-nitrogen hydrolase family protein n=1 Tax=Hamadaea tsunoensis TaxID=53368 RepID=UPI00041090E9|nr:carbon-nitrogen hydrolase family protein [Hamadaea tsunoensis]